jgi:DNA-binding transcriptional LysR family regulator
MWKAPKASHDVMMALGIPRVRRSPQPAQNHRPFLIADVFGMGCRARRVALTVPDFAMGLATVAESALIAAMPRRFVAMHAARFAVVSREVPLRLRAFSIRAAVPKVALMDAGLAWLFEAMCEVVQGGRGARDKRRAKAHAA